MITKTKIRFYREPVFGYIMVTKTTNKTMIIEDKRFEHFPVNIILLRISNNKTHLCMPIDLLFPHPNSEISLIIF